MARVREPIQVYLSTAERERLDRLASDLGVSRSEVLRQGLERIAERERDSALADLVRRGWLHPARYAPAPLPERTPIYGTVEEMLGELDETRADR